MGIYRRTTTIPNTRPLLNLIYGPLILKIKISTRVVGGEIGSKVSRRITRITGRGVKQKEEGKAGGRIKKQNYYFFTIYCTRKGVILSVNIKSETNFFAGMSRRRNRKATISSVKEYNSINMHEGIH